jgi:hypothetical protein
MPPEDLFFSKKGERKVSNFMAHELLYDYIADKLDSERAEAVKEFLKNSREGQSDIHRIQQGINYVDALSTTRVGTHITERVKAPSTYFQLLHQKMRIEDWSPGIKMGLEVLVVAILIISISIAIPWHKLMEINWSISRDVILAEVDRKPTGPDGEGVATTAAQDPSQVFPDEASGKVAPAKTKQESQKNIDTMITNLGNQTGENSTQAPALTAPDSKKAKSNEKLPSHETSAPATTPDHPKAVAIVEANTESASGAADKKGALYRGNIIVTNVLAITPKFVEKIRELGGRKAGEVELGWKKGESSYFHMTIPESKLQALQDFAKSYGQFKISKEKHDRVMPEGIIRIIFTIDEKKSP